MSLTIQNKNNIPRHIAIIPDGNRRWAKQQGQPSFFGHKAGANAIEKILDEALEIGVPCMTVWGCSVGNITKREGTEVQFLFSLFESFFKKMLKSSRLAEKGIRVRVLGEWTNYFPLSCQKVIQKLTDATKDNVVFNLTFLLAYSGTDEMLSAVRRVADLAQKQPALIIDQSLLKQQLWTSELPAVDLVIRTGGEPHFSTGFMMWDVAEARLYFTDVLWPDFSPIEFKKALVYYAEQERREGK